MDNRKLRLGEKIYTSEKNKTPIRIIIGPNDVGNKTLAVNIYNQDNLKDIELTKALKVIKNYLKEPIFDING